MSNNINIKKIWLIGAGSMSIDYIKVLKDINCDFTIIGRGNESACKCEKVTCKLVFRGGLEKYIEQSNEICSHAIVAVSVLDLHKTTMLLLECGVKNILLEKPGALTKKQLVDLQCLAKEKKANILIGYNRRFYKSTEKAQEIIKADGGVTSFNFEFTEWSHIIEKLDIPMNLKQKWFLGNSTHVVDLAFYLGGKPTEISCFTSGTLSWHKSSSIFTGAGKTDLGSLFSYQANWASPGRWGVEINTKKHRLIFRPMEKLHIQNIGSVEVDLVDIKDDIDLRYKPGLYNQVNSFLNGETYQFCTVDDQIDLFSFYFNIANY